MHKNVLQASTGWPPSLDCLCCSYGPISAIVILSFQGPNGGLTFPMNGFSVHWFSPFGEQLVGTLRPPS